MAAHPTPEGERSMSNESNDGHERNEGGQGRGDEGSGGREGARGRDGRPRRRRSRTLIALVTVLVVGTAGGGVLLMAADAWSHGGRWGGGKWSHGSPERWKEHLLDHSARWLGRVDATDEQRETIRGILGEAVDDFAGTVEEHRSLRREWLTALARPTLDAEALEALRAKHLDLADRKSRQMLDVVLRVGTVLTAEQRNDLLSDFARHRERRHERRKRRGGEEGG